MKWLPFAILALAATVLQTTLVPRVRFAETGPDLLLILAVHYALWGPWPDVGIAGWILGFIFGMHTHAPIGLHAFCYGAAVWGIVRLRQALFRDHPVTQFLINLAATFVVQLAVWLGLYWLSTVRYGLGQVLGLCLVTAVYTALVAPFVHSGLHHLSRWTGLRPGSRPPRYR